MGESDLHKATFGVAQSDNEIFMGDRFSGAAVARVII